MSSVQILRGESVILRAPIESDKEDRLACGRDPEFRLMVGGDPRTLPPLTTEEVEEWYKHFKSTPYSWIIEVDGHCIGIAKLRGFDQDNRQARYSIGIFSPDFRGKGYGTEATRLVLEYAFGDLALHRVDLRVLDFNKQAIACYEKCGFVREGLERESSWIGGRWQTDVMMSILEHEYAGK